MLQALRETGQDYIAEALDGLELNGLVYPHFRDGTPISQQKKVIRLLRNNFDTLISGRESEISSVVSIMEQNGFVVSDVSEGSIRITFRCFGTESLANLIKLYVDKTLDRLFTKEFCPEFSSEGLESVSIRIDESEFNRCHETFILMAPMTAEHRHALREAANTMSGHVVVNEVLIMRQALPGHQTDILRAIQEPTERAKTLLNIISRRPDEMFIQLINTLRETGQIKVADAIEVICKSVQVRNEML